MPAVTRAVADGFPIAGLVTSAGISLRIREALCQERTIAEVFVPVIGQRAQSGAHRLRSQVGRLSLGGPHQEAAVLHDEFQARDALRSAPTDGAIPILERVATGTPDQERDGAPGALDDLAELIADGPPRPEVVVGGELSVEGRRFGGRRDADGEGG